MKHPDYTLLLVDDPPASTHFYADLLGVAPVEQSPTFGLFVLEAGHKLALWSRHTVEPAPGAAAGAAEIGFRVDTDAEVDAAHADWAERGLRIAQAPTDLDFGRSFVALDPDGHRLRVFALHDA